MLNSNASFNDNPLVHLIILVLLLRNNGKHRLEFCYMEHQKIVLPVLIKQLTCCLANVNKPADIY